MFPELSLHDRPALLLVAPHPDDETLGFGATAATLWPRGVDVHVVSVSDGGGAYPDLSPLERTWLERTRRPELLRATPCLGVKSPVRLGLPDGKLCDHEIGLADTLSALLSQLRPAGRCAATWRGDGHPDHEAVGRGRSGGGARRGQAARISGVDVALGASGRRRRAVASNGQSGVRPRRGCE